MMDMGDNAVLPEEGIVPGPRTTQQNNTSTWAQVKPIPPADGGSAKPPGQLQHGQTKAPSGVRLVMRRVSALFNPNDDDDMDPDRRKSHYRRGSILIKHLENKKAAGQATEKDMKFFEMVKAQFDNNIMESRTIISLSVFQTGSNPLDDPFAVIHMPLEIQQGFRRKLFAIFSLQLFAVVVFICVFSYTPFIRDAFKPRFSKWPYVFGAFVLMVLALLWLYVVKYKFPINFFVLGLYTTTMSLFFAGFDYFFDTRASIFIFGFLFCIMAITTVLCTIVTKRSRDPNDPSSMPVLISYPVVLLVAFFLAFLGSLFIYFFYMKDVVSAVQYSASLAAMLLLVMWFAYDASCMNERLSPDEYMQGMVFFYTDMVLFLLFLSIIFVACFACEGDCACYGTADIAPIGTGGDDDEENDLVDEGAEGDVDGDQ